VEPALLVKPYENNSGKISGYKEVGHLFKRRAEAISNGSGISRRKVSNDTFFL
jgi:hypothetical protein